VWETTARNAQVQSEGIALIVFTLLNHLSLATKLIFFSKTFKTIEFEKGTTR
jgi:hypothetical protein